MSAYLEEINRAVSALVVADAVRFSRIGENDEAVFEHLSGLVGVYRRVVEIAEVQEFDEPVAALVSGICEVLKSRIREFEENAIDGENPIAAEKNAIIQEQLASLSAKTSTKTDMPEIFQRYNESLRVCQQRLDDLSTRKITGFYTDLIEREWEELGTIIKVQVLALEEANTSDNLTLASIMGALREAYQQLCPVVENLQSILHSPVKDSRTFEQFESEIYAALAPETVELLRGMEYKKAEYNLRLALGAEILLAEEITSVFEATLMLLISTLCQAKPHTAAQNREASALASTESEILDGIRETIEIKILGLRENMQAFKKLGNETIKAFAETKPTPAIFENAERHIKSFAELLEKQKIRFKKEILLYEICTYEEILAHSVSRLRGSGDTAVLGAVEALDTALDELNVILKKNNISVIRPAVKEMFNAKEHEILVAEKHSDFEKGEIIKVMTAGYRVEGQVVLRANVVAAR
ncbi:MAG: nucleotide exchange factor GrpE [Defluviitaleaceae bacterium]|nr:nucleotide exchange factor GrpE [Defluviitaleaceae bacterium]